MALPIAHAAAGYLVHRAACRVPSRGRASARAWRHAAILMVVGNLPDFDFLIGFVAGRPGLLHRGVSHTVLAAVVFGVLAGLAARRWRGEPFLPTALAFGAAYGSHLVVDWLTIDSRPPSGGQFLWPFSAAHFIAPVTVFQEIYIDGVTRSSFLATVLAWPTIVVLVRELVLVLGVVAVWHAAEGMRARLLATSTLQLESGREDLA